MTRLAIASCLLLGVGCAPNGGAFTGRSSHGTSLRARPCNASMPPLDTLVHDSTTVTTRPEIRSAGRVEYPEDLRQDRNQGIVVLQVWITSTGEVDSTALDSATDVGFIGAAVTSILHTTFWPACIGDHPVRYTAPIPVKFTLARH